MFWCEEWGVGFFFEVKETFLDGVESGIRFHGLLRTIGKNTMRVLGNLRDGFEKQVESAQTGEKI